MDILLFPVYKQYMYSLWYISCLLRNTIVKMVSLQRGQIGV